MPKKIKRIFSLGSIGAAFLTPALAMSCYEKSEQDKIIELFDKMTPEIKELVSDNMMNKSRYKKSKLLIQQQQVYEDQLKIKNWWHLIKFQNYRVMFRPNDDKLRIFSIETSKNWIFQIIHNRPNFSLSKKDLKFFAIKSVKLVESNKIVKARSIDNLPPIFLEPTKFVEHDRVKFTSGWGVSNNDTGSYTWKTELNKKDIRKFYSGYLDKVYGEKIHSPTMTIKGIMIHPYYSIQDTPINNADVDYSIKIDGRKIYRLNVDIPLPSGSKSGQEWWRGVASAGVLLAIVGGAALANWGTAAAATKLATLAAKAIAKAGVIAKGKTAIALSAATILTLGLSTIGISIAAQSFLNAFNAFVDDLNLSSDRSTIANETIRKILLQSVNDYVYDKIDEKIWSFFSKGIIDAIRKIESREGQIHLRKKVKSYIEKHKKSKNFISLFDNDEAYYVHKKIIENHRESKSTFEAFTKNLSLLGSYIKYFSNEDSKPISFFLDNFDEKIKIEIRSGLFASGKASTIFMDSSEMGLIGLNVSIFGSLVYESITYDRI